MGPPRPTEPQNPPSNKKRNSENPKTFEKPLFTKSKRSFRKSKRSSPKVSFKYFWGIFEEFKVFEISCWGVTVTGVSKRSNSYPLATSSRASLSNGQSVCVSASLAYMMQYICRSSPEAVNFKLALGSVQDQVRLRRLFAPQARQWLSSTPWTATTMAFPPQ